MSEPSKYSDNRQVLFLAVNYQNWTASTVFYEQQAIAKTMPNSVFYGPGYCYNTNSVPEIINQTFGAKMPEAVFCYINERRLLDEPLNNEVVSRYGLEGELRYFPKRLNEVKIPKIAWINDFWHCTSQEWEQILLGNGFDMAFATYCPPFVSREIFDLFFSRRVQERVKFIPWPRAINPEIYKDYNLKKEYDVTCLGAMNESFYPLRSKMHCEFSSMAGIRYFHQQHPGYKFISNEGVLTGVEYAKAINRSKIFASCTGKYHIPFIKLYEIMACGTVLMCDKPAGGESLGLKENENYAAVSEDNFIHIAKQYLSQPQEIDRLARNARELSLSRHTVDIRAAEFSRTISDILSGREPKGWAELNPSKCLISAKRNTQSNLSSLNQSETPKKNKHITEIARPADEKTIFIWQKYGVNNRPHENPPVVTEYPDLVVLRGVYLRQLAEQIGAKYLAEVGTARGFQSMMWAQYLSDTGRIDGMVYTCDINGMDKRIYKTPLTGDVLFTRQELWQEVPQSRYINFTHGTSEKLASSILYKLDMLYIDGEHTEKAVKFDFKNLRGLLRPGSIVVFDDCDKRFAGIQRAVHEISSSLKTEVQIIEFHPHKYKIAVIQMPAANVQLDAEQNQNNSFKNIQTAFLAGGKKVHSIGTGTVVSCADKIRKPQTVCEQDLMKSALESNQWLSPSEIEHHQFQDLKKLIEHAYQNVPFYRRQFHSIGLTPKNILSIDDFRRIPILKKSDIQRNLEQLKAINCPPAELIRDATGGSTGEPLIFYRDLNAKRLLHYAFLRFREGWLGYHDCSSKVAFIWGAERDFPQKAPPNQRWLNSFNCSEIDIEKFIQELVEWKPDAIRAYATSLHMVASYIKKKGLKAPRPKVIESSAEKIMPWQRELAEEVFQCKVFDQYGSRELPVLACECEYQTGLHIFSDLRLIEIIKDGRPAAPGEEGSIVITDLINYGMPFIRYEIGDVGILSPESCPCGRGFPLLKEVKGRVTSTIRTPDGRLIHGGYFRRLFYYVTGIKVFQVHQTKLDEIIISIQPDVNFDRRLIEPVIEKMRFELGGNVRVEWKCVDDIPKTSSGKRHFVISDIPVDFVVGNETQSTQIKIPAADNKSDLKPENQARKKILFVVDTPGWAHDFKTDNLIRCLSNDYAIKKVYNEQVNADDIDSADLVVFYYWIQLDRLKLDKKIEVLTRNRHKLLIGICSGHEMEGKLREAGLTTLQNFASGVFINCMLLYREFAKEFNVPVFYTPNGVDTKFYCPAANKTQRKKLRAGWAGSITNHGTKRGYHDFIVPAVRSLDGVELVTAAREEKWRGPDEMLEFYKSLDVYICASREEGTPNPCLEAAACGVPLLTTRVGNMPELIEDGRNGFFIERNVDDIAEKLKLLRDNPQLKEQLGKGMLESIKQWDWSVQAENYRKMFEQMLSGDIGIETGQIMSLSQLEGVCSSEAVKYFLMAQQAFNIKRFLEALELMHKYRTSVQYKELPRFVRSSDKSEVDVSVVIITHNRTEDLKKCIESVNRQQVSRDKFEIIVVDNGLTDEEAIKPLCEQYIKCPVNLGLSEGRNIGACFARGKILAFLDDDALVGSEYISSIKEAFDTYDIFGFRGKVLPKTSNEANKQAVNYDRGDEVFCTFCDQEGNSAFLTEVYLNANGMDPLLFGAEGTDLTYRIIEKYNSLNKIIYWPKTIIYHDNAPQDVQIEKQKRYELMRQYFYLKHSREISEYRKEVEEKQSPEKRQFNLEQKNIQVLPRKSWCDDAEIPVALITYNRPKHTCEVLNALKEHNIKNIYIFSDGPKKEEDVEKVAAIRKLAKSIDWAEPKIIEYPENVGLARNIVGAADHILAEHDRLIVLEDDCVPQKYFFDFMRGCLDRYRDNEKVFGISGYTVQIPEPILKQWPYDLYFYPRMGSCGWATWKRAWQYREKDLRAAYQKTQQKNIDVSQGGNDVPVMIEQFLTGRLKEVWTLNWVLTVYLHGGFYIYPVQSHIKNIGFDGSGVHVGKSTKFDSKIADSKPEKFPQEIVINEAIYNNFRSFYDIPGRPRSSISVPSRVINSSVAGSSITTSTISSEKPLKIVHVCTHDHGGAGKAAYRLHKSLQSIGHDSSMLVISKKTDDPSVHIAKSSVSAEQIYTRNRMLLEQFPNRPAGLEMYSDNFSASDLAAEPLIQQADIVNLHWVAGMLNYNSIHSALKNKAVVWTLHDMNPFTGGCHYSGDCERYKQDCGQCFQLGSNQAQDLSWQVWQQKRQAYDGAEINIVTPSRWLADCSKNSSLFGGFNTEVIPNSLPVDIYKPVPKEAVRKALNIRADAKVILFGAGSIVNERKGFRYLLEALKSFEFDTGSPIYLATFGGMPKNIQIESKYPVYNFGHISEEKDLALLYSMADVFVLPSLEDNLPNIILEAMACGTPVVSFRVGGIPDMVEHRKTGYLVNPKDVEGLKEGIKWVLSAQSQGTGLSHACRGKVERLYTPDVQAKACENLYKRLSRKISSGIAAKPIQVKSPVNEGGYLVSAVVSTYNSERFIRGCLEDLENQTIADRIEIIVVNSGSEQNEESIVKEFQQRYKNIKYIKTEQRETIYKAWNRAIETASGKYITIANTDDRRRKDAIEVMVSMLDANQDIALVYADQYETTSENQTFENVTVSKENIYPNFEKDIFVNLGWCNIGSQPMWRAEIHREIGNFDGNFEIAGDYDFLLRVCEKYECFHIPQILGTFYRSAGKTVSCSNTFRLSRIENPLAKARSLVRRAIKCIEQADYSKAGEYLHKSITCWPSREVVEYIQVVQEKTGQIPTGSSNIRFEFLASIWDWPREMLAKSNTVPVAKQFSDSGSSKYLLSAIISECKSSEEVDSCLAGLAAQSISNKTEVLVVSKTESQIHRTIGTYRDKFANLLFVEAGRDENITTSVNRALQKSGGEFVTIIKPAFRYVNSGLDKTIEILRQDISKAAVYACIGDTDAFSEKDIKQQALFAENLNSGRLIWRRGLHNQLGWFDESFSKMGEYEFWHRIDNNFSIVREPNILESCPCSSDEYDFDVSFEKGLIKKAYQYAGLCKISLDSCGISRHEVFSKWFEVNILKKRTWEKIHNRRYNPVRQIDDHRPSEISPLLSVIIVTCDRNQALLRNLDSLSHQSEKNFEVIIVNNGSLPSNSVDNGSLDICWINLDNNYGPSLARNVGAEHSRSPYLVFLDDDAVPDRCYVEKIITHFRQHDICGLRGRILSPVGGYVPDMYDLGDEVIPYAADMEGNCAFKKEVFNQAGGFSEWLFHGEGMDLSYRIYTKQGEDVDKMLYFPDVIIHHQPYGNQLYRLERILRAELMGKLLEENNPCIKKYENYMFNFYPINRKNTEYQLGRLFNNAAFLLDKKPQKALEWAKLAKKNFPNVFGPRFILGSAYLKTGDFQNAKKELLDLFFGMEDLFAQDTREAKELLGDKNECIKEMYLQTVVRLSQCCFELGDYNTIKIVYEKALQNTQVEIPEQQRNGMEKLCGRLKTMSLPEKTYIPVEKPIDISPAAPQKEYLVSAIVSTYNAEDLIRGCLEDLENQTIADKLEIIVVNSGSQQNEEAIVKEFQSKYDNIVYIKTEQREGIYTAWNRAVKAARGLFLTNANTDDRHRRDALEILSGELLNNPDAALVYADQIYTDTINCTFEKHRVVRAEPYPDYSRERLLQGCCVGSQPMWRKSIHDGLGYFDETLDCASDWDFWIRISEKYPLKRVPEFLGLYYYNRQGIEHGRKRHGYYERYVVGKRYGTPYISSFNKYEERKDWLVSVIMPAYNCEKFIREAIESVLIQNYRNFELIIINDGSTDGTEEIIHSYKDEHIRYFKQENRGLAATHNEGIRQSRGEFLVKVDTDDFITVDFIGKHLNEFYNHPDADLVYCDDCLIEDNGEPIRIIKRPEYTDRRMLIRDLFQCGFPVVPFRTCIRKRVFDKIGLFDDNLRMAEDYDMIRRFVKADLKAHHLPAALYYRRLPKDSLSRKHTEEKIRTHFGVWRKFLETFSYEELFPDVDWEKMSEKDRHVHAKCLTASIAVRIGQSYMDTNVPLYTAVAMEEARSHLGDFAQNNVAIEKLSAKCEQMRHLLLNKSLQNV